LKSQTISTIIVMKLLTSLVLALTLASASFAAAPKTSSTPTIEQMVPPFNQTTNKGGVLSNDGSKVVWSPRIGFAGVNAQTASYKLAPTDANKLVTFTVDSGEVTLTVPLNLAVPVGTEVDGSQLSNGYVNIVGETGVTIVSLREATQTDGRGATFKLKKVDTNTWLLTGSLHQTKGTFVPGRTIIITITGEGTTPFQYQWKKDGAPLPGETGVSFVKYNSTTEDAGTYTCVVTNTAGSLESPPYVLAVRS
jgi:hypothetical protein